MINHYGDFLLALGKAGFSGAVGGKDEGVFGLFRYEGGAGCCGDIRWHTGDPDTDPWQWRVRVLDEGKEIAYGKLFFRKAGYITKEWYPCFLSARRRGEDFDSAYDGGLQSRAAKRIYELLREHGALSLHEIKSRGGFDKNEKARFDKAMTDLQMGLYITMRGLEQKRSAAGEEYGWASTVFSLAEDFWPPEVFSLAAKLDAEEAAERISERVFALNPAADRKKLARFITG